MKNKGFRIGNLNIFLDKDIIIDEGMDQYSINISEDMSDVVKYNIEIIEEFQPLQLKIIRNEKFPPQLIGIKDDREVRVHIQPFEHEFCAVYEEKEECIKVQIKTQYEFLEGKSDLLNYFALEKQLMKKECYILHCAYIIFKGKAILLSGNSGIGKSTQAELWRCYKNAEIINGDRCVIRKMDGKWVAEGLPFCGSSKINKNKRAEIGAIVFLGQSPENSIKSCTLIEGIHKLYGQFTVNTWNDEFVQKVLNVCEEMTNEIQIIEFKCDKTEKAVSVLDNYLKMR